MILIVFTDNTIVTAQNFDEMRSIVDSRKDVARIELTETVKEKTRHFNSNTAQIILSKEALKAFKYIFS